MHAFSICGKSYVGSSTGSGVTKVVPIQEVVAVKDRRMALCIRAQKNPPRIKAQNLMLSRQDKHFLNACFFCLCQI